MLQTLIKLILSTENSKIRMNKLVHPLLKSSMVICHGLFGSKQNWKTMSHAFHKKRCGSICTTDLRNHGQSPHSPDMSYVQMAGDVIHLSNTLDLHNLCLVGHSMGGKTAMCAALLKVCRAPAIIILSKKARKVSTTCGD
ncbi:unnamed protein product [Echinostoma caproni]|uniref:sn-1-specific diacylglycerol lipase ABHD11 n=1 Tax=Echinostoma caproni TaxID=27848 RepID=A0A3P8LA24_9TREM|nr:unnamed protein product [Echinostoma caproni]